MLQIPIQKRPDLLSIADTYGFDFHTIEGEPYWDESRFYQFTLQQIERDLEDPTAELEQICLDLVDRVLRDERWLRKLQIPEQHWQQIADSWQRRDPSLYGRMDFAYHGSGPAKLLEYNADTPTSLYEAAFFQWVWLENMVDRGLVFRGADQFNSIQEKLIQRLAQISGADHAMEAGLPRPVMHFSSCRDSKEDRGTVLYLEDCAKQAGIDARFLYIDDIGINHHGQFTDLDDNEIATLFKLYPWEWMLEDEFSHYFQHAKTRFVEPMWKSILSNKGILPLLWQWHPNHPNLLPCYFEHETGEGLEAGYVRKPLFSREGANIEMVKDNRLIEAVEGDYGAEGHVLQALSPLPKFSDSYTLIGSWVVGHQPAGLTIREDNSLITQDSSRFVPHVIVG